MTLQNLHDDEWQLIKDLRGLTQNEKTVIEVTAHTLFEAHRSDEILPPGVLMLRPLRTA